MWQPVNYGIVRNLGSLDENDSVRVNWMTWGGGEVRLDIRKWFERDGQMCPGRGILLSANEARNLLAILHRQADENGLEAPDL